MRQISRPTRTPRRPRSAPHGRAPRALVRGRTPAAVQARPARRRAGTPARRRIAASERRARRAAAARALARAASPRARRARHRQLDRVDGSGAAQQHDLRAPPRARRRRARARARPGRRPAGHRASAARCAGARARTAPAPTAIARDRAPADHRRQPHDQLRDRRREPRRPRRVPEPEQVALDRVRARLQPIITRRRAPARAARPRRAARTTTSRPGSAGSGSLAGRYQRRDDARRERRSRSSGTANARRRHGSTKHCARERTLAAQLDEPGRAAAGERLRRSDDPTPGIGVGDPSGARLEFGAGIYVGSSRSRSGSKAAHERPGCSPVFLVKRPSPGGPRASGRIRRGQRVGRGRREPVLARWRYGGAPRTPPRRISDPFPKRPQNQQTPRCGAAFGGEPSAGLEPATPSLPWKCSTN